MFCVTRPKPAYSQQDLGWDRATMFWGGYLSGEKLFFEIVAQAQDMTIPKKTMLTFSQTYFQFVTQLEKVIIFHYTFRHSRGVPTDLLDV